MSMEQAIKNILQKPEPVKRFFIVVKPLAGGRYQVKDSQDRHIDVDSAVTWKPGDGVTVTQGRIVGRATRFSQPKIVNV